MTGFVYFIHAPRAKRIKIGWTSRPPHLRLRALLCVSPMALRGLGVIPAEKVSEKELHRRFGEFRSHGEWFDAHRPLMDYIRDNAEPWPVAPARKPKAVGQPKELSGAFVFSEFYPPEHRPREIETCSVCGRAFKVKECVTEYVGGPHRDPIFLCEKCADEGHGGIENSGFDAIEF